MDPQVLTTVISGTFALVAAFGSVLLKHHLEQRGPARVHPDHVAEKKRAETAPPRQDVDAATPSSEVGVSEHPGTARLRPALIVMAGWVVGAGSRLARGAMESGTLHWEAILSLAALLAATIGFVLHHRKPLEGRSAGLFQLDNLGLWASYASGWSIIHGSAWGDLLALCGAGWFGCALVGGLLVASSKRS